MFSVGLDVDTTITLVSLNMVTYFIIIWLFAGKFILRASPPTVNVVGKNYNSYFIFLYFFYLYFYFFYIFKIIKVKINKFKIFIFYVKQSADNFLVFLIKEKAEVIFHIKSSLISKNFLISDHLKKHKKPDSLEEIGYYIAGLIEGSSQICVGEINIFFNIRDISLAFFVKKIIGYGLVKIDKKVNICYYKVIKKEGRKKILNLINGKLRGYEKIEQFKKYDYDKEFNINILPPANFDILNNYWLTGFSENNSYFIIYLNSNKIVKNKLNLKLIYNIFHKNEDFLLKIKETFGGCILKNNNKDFFEYTTSSFENAKKIISYFDKFQLNSTKFISYIKWRKVYRIIQRNEHLTLKGINKICRIKKKGIDFKV